MDRGGYQIQDVVLIDPIISEGVDPHDDVAPVDVQRVGDLLGRRGHQSSVAPLSTAAHSEVICLHDRRIEATG